MMISQRTEDELRASEESYARIMMAIGTDVQSGLVSVRRADLEQFAAMFDCLCNEIADQCDDMQARRELC